MEQLFFTLHELLRKYIDQNFNCNVPRAARELNLSYKMLRNIYSGTFKSISFIDAALVFRSVGYDGDSLLKKIYPLDFSTYIKLNTTETLSSLENLLKYVVASDIRTELFNYVCAVPCVRSDIIKAFGDLGGVTLSEMINRRVLEIAEDGEIISRLGKDFSLSADTSKKFAERNLNSIDPEMVGTVFAAPVVALNRLGLRRGSKLALEFFNAIESIAEDPECKGSIVVVGSVGYGPLARTFDDGNLEDQDRLNRFKKAYQLDDQASAMVAGLVHDMRGPFSHMVQYINAQTKANEASAEAIRAKSAAKRVDLMINSLRTMKGEEIIGRQKELFYWDEVLDLGNCLSQDYGTDFFFLGQKEFEGYIDPEKLQRAVENLLANAFEAAKSEVTFECVREKDSLQICISDDGMGVPDEYVPQLFHQGFTAGKENGTGFGLVNVRRVALGHEGDITYTRLEDRTVFTLILNNVFLDANLKPDIGSLVKETEEKTYVFPGEHDPQYIYMVAALREKPVLFYSCADKDFEKEILSSNNPVLKQFLLSSNERELFRSWIACTDSLDQATAASENRVQKIWSLSTKSMINERFLPALINLAEKELRSFTTASEQWKSILEKT